LIHISPATCYKEGREAVAMLRFSLLTLLGVVLVAAIGSAALANPTNTWRQVIVTGTVVILLITTSAAVVKRPGLPFARGFAATGWLYFLLVFGSNFRLQDHLLTDVSVDRLYALISDDVGATSPAGYEGSYGYDSDYGEYSSGGGGSMYSSTMGGGYPGSGPPKKPNKPNFAAIGRSLWTLILATIGGLFASWLGRRRDTGKPATSELAES